MPDSNEYPDLRDAVKGAISCTVEEREISDVHYEAVDLRFARAESALRHRLGEGWAVKIL